MYKQPYIRVSFVPIRVYLEFNNLCVTSPLINRQISFKVCDFQIGRINLYKDSFNFDRRMFSTKSNLNNSNNNHNKSTGNRKTRPNLIDSIKTKNAVQMKNPYFVSAIKIRKELSASEYNLSEEKYIEIIKTIPLVQSMTDGSNLMDYLHIVCDITEFFDQKLVTKDLISSLKCLNVLNSPSYFFFFISLDRLFGKLNRQILNINDLAELCYAFKHSEIKPNRLFITLCNVSYHLSWKFLLRIIFGDKINFNSINGESISLIQAYKLIAHRLNELRALDIYVLSDSMTAAICESLVMIPLNTLLAADQHIFSKDTLEFNQLKYFQSIINYLKKSNYILKKSHNFHSIMLGISNLDASVSSYVNQYLTVMLNRIEYFVQNNDISDETLASMSVGLRNFSGFCEIELKYLEIYNLAIMKTVKDESKINLLDAGNFCSCMLSIRKLNPESDIAQKIFSSLVKRFSDRDLDDKAATALNLGNIVSGLSNISGNTLHERKLIKLVTSILRANRIRHSINPSDSQFENRGYINVDPPVLGKICTGIRNLTTWIVAENRVEYRIDRLEMITSLLYEVTYLIDTKNSLDLNLIEMVVVLRSMRNFTGSNDAERYYIFVITNHIENFTKSFVSKPILDSRLLISLLENIYRSFEDLVDRGTEVRGYLHAVGILANRVLKLSRDINFSNPNISYSVKGLRLLTGEGPEELALIKTFGDILRRRQYKKVDGVVVGAVCHGIKSLSVKSYEERYLLTVIAEMLETIPQVKLKSWGFASLFSCLRYVDTATLECIRLLKIIIEIVRANDDVNEYFSPSDLAYAMTGIKIRMDNVVVFEEMQLFDELVRQIEKCKYKFTKHSTDLNIPTINSFNIGKIFMALQNLPGQSKPEEKRILNAVFKVMDPIIDDVYLAPRDIANMVYGLKNITDANSEETKLLQYVSKMVCNSPFSPFEMIDISNLCHGLKSLDGSTILQRTLFRELASRIKRSGDVVWDSPFYISLACNGMQSLTGEGDILGNSDDANDELAVMDELTKSIRSYLDKIALHNNSPSLKFSGTNISRCYSGMRSLRGSSPIERNFIKLICDLCRMNSVVKIKDPVDLLQCINGIQSLEFHESSAEALDAIQLLSEIIERSASAGLRFNRANTMGNVCVRLGFVSGRTKEERALIRSITRLIDVEKFIDCTPIILSNICLGFRSMTGNTEEEKGFILSTAKCIESSWEESVKGSMSQEIAMNISEGLANLNDDYEEVVTLKKALIPYQSWFLEEFPTMPPFLSKSKGMHLSMNKKIS